MALRRASQPWRWWGVLAAVLTAMMAVRIASTYTVFTQTFDEPFHVACGMEWLDQGTYHYEALHPPLARIAAAVGPFLASRRSQGLAYPVDEGNAILYDGSRYTYLLALARLGELPFALLACAGVWVLASYLFGPVAAGCSVFLFSLLPPVLAHGGLATTDIAITATSVWAFYAFARFLERPDTRSGAFLGLWVGAALISKASAIVFLGAGFAAISAVYLLVSNRKQTLWGLLTGAIPAAITAFLVLWACYRFAFGPLFTANELSARASDFSRILTQPGAVHALVTRVPVPAPAYFRGLGQAFRHNNPYAQSYLWGMHGIYGWWYFFPLVLSVKTPLGFLLLAAPGVVALLLRVRRFDWKAAIPGVGAAAILGACMLSRINMGVRHILPIYPLLSVAAGYFAVIVCRTPASRVFAVICLLWCGIASLRAHPDYLAYFNEIASRHPERVLLDSDLDWGQDLARLSRRLNDLHATSVRLSYWGTARLDLSGLPPMTRLSCGAPLSGYIAISVRNLFLGGPLGPCPQYFDQFARMVPAERVGKSIFLYHFPEKQSGESGSESSRSALRPLP